MNLKDKEKEVEISRLQHNILETELKLLKKLEEVERIKESINKFRETLDKKQGK